MKEDISKVTALIPDIFYDIIARMTVGIIFGIGLLYLTITQQNINPSIIQDWTFLFNPLLIIFLVIFISYIIGFLIGTLSIAYYDFFIIGFNPAVDLVSIITKAKFKRRAVLFIEFILGLPFSLFFIKYLSKEFEKSYNDKLNSLIDKYFPGIEGDQKIKICRDYVRSTNREFGSILVKRQAETSMCRSLAIAMLILMIYSMIYNLWNELLFEWFIFALSTCAYSHTRRTYATNIYNYFFLIGTLNDE